MGSKSNLFLFRHLTKQHELIISNIYISMASDYLLLSFPFKFMFSVFAW